VQFGIFIDDTNSIGKGMQKANIKTLKFGFNK
jgi:hypothetical protein